MKKFFSGKMLLIFCVVSFLWSGCGPERTTEATAGTKERGQEAFSRDDYFDIMKDVFPIGVWYDGRVEGINCAEGYVDVPSGQENAERYYRKTFRDIKEHNVEVVVIPNTPPDYRETLLKVADEVGVKIVLELVEVGHEEFGEELWIRSPDMIQDEEVLRERLGAIIEPLKGHESLFAYQLVDEPRAHSADNFRLVARILRELDPEHPSFSALCILSELHRTSRMGTPMVVFDSYVLRKEHEVGGYDFRNWISIVENVRRPANGNGLPYWMVIQTFKHPNGIRYPTKAELRLLTYLSLAHNCKGIFFFLYNSMTQSERMHGLVDTELRPTEIWGYAGELAWELKQLREVVLDIEPAETFAMSADEDIHVQCFEDERGGRYFFAANLDVLEGAIAEVVVTDFVEGARPEFVRDMLTGEALEVNCCGEASISVELEAGDCRLFRLE